MKIPYTALPKNPHTGINVLIWHREFTIGTGKLCPFQWMVDNTDRLYKDIAAFLKPYQEGSTTTPTPQPVPTPTPTPVPQPQYAQPVPVPKLAELGAQDQNTAKALVIDGATNFHFVSDKVRAIRNTPRYQRASTSSAKVGPDIKAGEQFDVLWFLTEADGRSWYITPWWSRVLVADTERIKD
jgi:hypothetical protein